MARRPVALVTGAANGIGRAIAKLLTARGWRVAAVDLPRAGLRRVFPRRGGNILLIEGNVATDETAKEAVREVLRHYGRVDAIVSNAGIMVRKPIQRLTVTEWHRVLDVNLAATFLLVRAAERALRASRGAVATIASTRALMSEPHTEAYSASKGGLVALTHALAVSLAPDVRVNCVSPGWIQTRHYGELRRKDHSQHPAGRVGKPRGVAEMVAFLLDPERSGFVTGANFVVDGGMTRKMIYEE
jgi:NAD(P)-dependent dehydrogenase (short-subunit alcohol dehydrogenase family)